VGQLCSAENVPVFSPVRLSIQKLYFASDEALKSFVYRSPDMISVRVQIWRVRWTVFLLNHLQTARVQALSSDTCCVHVAHASIA